MSARLQLGVLICLLTAGFLLREEVSGTFKGFEKGWVAWLTNSSGASEGQKVAFIRIDDSEERIFESWPLSPGDYALLLQNLRNFEPQLVGIAPSLRWEKPGLLYDSLIRELDAIPQTVLGTELSFLEAEGGFVDPALAALFQPIEDIIGNRKRVPAITTVLDLPQDEVRAGRPLAFTRLGNSVGNRLATGELTVPLLARYGDAVIPGFVLQLAMLNLEVPVSEVKVSLGRWIRMADTEIPIDETGSMVVNMGLRDFIPRVNASALLLGSDLESTALTEEELLAIRLVKESAVVIGIDDRRFRSVQVPDTEVGMISPADFLVTALGTIQGGRYVRELGLPGKMVIWVLAFFGASVLFLFPARKSLLLGFALVTGFGIFGFLAFLILDVWASPIVPLGTLFVAIVAAGMTSSSGQPEEEERSE